MTAPALQRIAARLEPKAKPFGLGRQFVTVGLVSIAVLAAASAFLLSRLFADRMLQQEGQFTMQFVQGVIDVEHADRFFEPGAAAQHGYMEDLLAHVAGAPDVLRANLYGRDRTMIWSSDAALEPGSFADAANEELDAALAGELEIHWEGLDGAEHEKAEHSHLADGGDFIELYVPVWNSSRTAVVGAVELYRAPRLLRKSIDSGVRIIWLSAAGGGLLLYLALLPLVRRADTMLRAQHRRIVEAETQAAIGDLGSAVAHGIRNPLAVIRSSAEIIRERDDARIVRDAVSDIIDHVDRLEHWIRELLTYVHVPHGEAELVDAAALVQASVANFTTEARRRGIAVETDFPPELPKVHADGVLLGQVFNSLIANAVEAMSGGGVLRLDGVRDASDRVAIRVRDTGVGMTDAQLQCAFRPFQTTKVQGLGVGLPLARRIVERMGGRIELASTPGLGTVATVWLPVGKS